MLLSGKCCNKNKLFQKKTVLIISLYNKFNNFLCSLCFLCILCVPCGKIFCLIISLNNISVCSVVLLCALCGEIFSLFSYCYAVSSANSVVEVLFFSALINKSSSFKQFLLTCQKLLFRNNSFFFQLI